MTNGDDFAEGLLDETREEIDRADTKANILLAGAGVTAAVLVGALANGDITLGHEHGVVQVVASLSGTALGIGLVLLGAAVLPQIGRAVPGRARYFMDHAQYATVDELRAAVEGERTDQDLRHLTQLLTLSRIVRRKYRLTQAGEIVGGAGLVLAVAAALLHHLL
jgi:hypothetical protein